MMRFRSLFLDQGLKSPLVIYDLGSQDINGTYRPIFSNPNWRYMGIDTVSGKNVDIVLRNRYVFRELQSNSADVIISGQAFEHIEYFWVTMLEIVRVLKPGGICCILAPSSGPEHRYPCDCWRWPFLHKWKFWRYPLNGMILGTLTVATSGTIRCWFAESRTVGCGRISRAI